MKRCKVVEEDVVVQEKIAEVRREELIAESQEEDVAIKKHVVSDARVVSEVRGIVNRVGNVTTILTYTFNNLF
jgi:hypothetical protein